MTWYDLLGHWCVSVISHDFMSDLQTTDHTTSLKIINARGVGRTNIPRPIIYTDHRWVILFITDADSPSSETAAYDNNYSYWV